MFCGFLHRLAVLAIALVGCSAIVSAAEPAAINPFGARPAERPDAVPGYVELSSGEISCGMIYLTRDARLKVLDEKLNRQREIPLSAVRQIDCEVRREWMEREWRFKELASDEKMYTGRRYPAREYTHTITLLNGRKIKGPLSAIVYVAPAADAPAARGPARRPTEPRRFMLHKRDKGKVATELKSLVYVRTIKLGEESLEEGRRKAQPKKTERVPKRQSSQQEISGNQRRLVFLGSVPFRSFIMWRRFVRPKDR